MPSREEEMQAAKTNLENAIRRCLLSGVDSNSIFAVVFDTLQADKKAQLANKNVR
jgi:DNA-directed RNA polymerase alpha subunit